MHLSMLSPTRGRAGIHGHLTRVFSPWVGILILFDITEPPRSGDLTFTGYQSPTCFRLEDGRFTAWHAICLYVAFCDANGTLSSFGLRFNLLVVLFAFCDRKFSSIKNRSEKNPRCGCGTTWQNKSALVCSNALVTTVFK